MKTTTTVLDCHERCRKFENECRRSGKSSEECKTQRRRCEKSCGYM